MPLTAKQEHFAQLVAAGATHAAAYRQSYDVSPDAAPDTIYQEAHNLSIHPHVSPRIEALRAAYIAEITASQRWNIDKMVSEAETQLALSREGGWRGVSSGNGALEIIGRATGLLSDKQREPALPAITRVVVVLNQGKDPEGKQVITEAAYEVLPLKAGDQETVP